MIKKYLLVGLIAFYVQDSSAQGLANNYEVNFVRVDRSGLGYVEFKTQLTGTPPACVQTGYKNALSFDTNQPGGKAILSVVLSAQASGKKILAVGTGNCNGYQVMEQWDWGVIQ